MKNFIRKHVFQHKRNRLSNNIANFAIADRHQLQLWQTDKSMKVYARHFSDKDLNFRLDTVLQFGESWDVMGVAVLINPGSARPIAEIGSDITTRLLSITGLADNWKEFSADSTMRQLAKIFSGWYVGEDKPMNGCILLFNLFKLRDKNLTEALELQSKCRSEYLFSSRNDISRLADAERIYLGWGNAGKYQLRQYAEPIFEVVKSRCPYLNPDFIRNAFYHPGYINRSYKKESTRRWLEKF